jgi:hypothetical protein
MTCNLTQSISPAGESFPLPTKEDYSKELNRIEALVQQARSENKEIVVVMGLGFVGAVMAAIVADTKDAGGKNSKFVIGCQRPSPRSFWKIPLINRGEAPVKAEDPEVDVLIKRCVLDDKTLVATYNSDCLQFADCVVVDVQCDFAKKELGNMKSGEADGRPATDDRRMRTDDRRMRTDDRRLKTVISHPSSVIGHPLQRQRTGGAQTHRDERRDPHPRPLCGPLVRTGRAGHLPLARKFVEALFPEPGGAETNRC